MRSRFSIKAFTLVEMMVTLGAVVILGAGLALFGFTSSRFVARNLATNHSHESALVSEQTLLKELRDAASAFRQFNFDGTNYTDITPATTTNVDAQTGKFAGTRSNGVRFRQIYAGPLQMTANAASNATTLTFNFPAGTTTPLVGDKLALPLISEEFDITAVTGTGTTRTITLAAPVGFTLNVSNSPNQITGYFYRRVAFSVYDNELRFHPNFSGTARNTYRVIRRAVTSPKPFSMIFDSSGATDSLSVRVSLEITDLGYKARKFGNGTTTLYCVIPARNQPTVLSSTN